MQQLLAGWTHGFTLLVVGLAFFVYFLPAIMAFWKAQRRFYVVLALNLLVSPVQSFLLHLIDPALQLADVGPATLLLALLVNLGPGWVALLIWSLWPGATDPKLEAARETKWFDLFAAMPLIIWFGVGALNLRPILLNDLGLILRGQAGMQVWVQFFALAASAAFNLLLVWLLLVRDKPVRRGRGVWGRIFAVAGTFLGVGMLQLPTAQLNPAMQILAAAMVGLGSLASLLVLWRLGHAFSIMPEARVLVTQGPYAHARHPLYAVEMITIAGTAIQFQQPWAGVIAAGVLTLLVVRSIFEERVLGEAYPEYAAYKAKTARFVPGIV